MKKEIFLCIFIWFAGTIPLLFLFEGPGDIGDGIMHYMFARYAHVHPQNFLDPWAKTGFTLVAWPFAQFGIKGMMCMNILAGALSLYCVFQISRLLNIKHSWVACIVLALSTYYFTLVFSGLTEHVFSLITIASIYLLLKNKWTMASLLLSTLPFFRQEGYIIMISLIPFFILQKKLKYVLLFPTSFMLIGMIGGIYFRDIFWIIRSNPYGLHQSYGHGGWFDFCDKLYYHVGLINLLFFVAGMIALLVRGKNPHNKTLFWLVFVPFVVFFIAHTSFWALGIFHSLGMSRVLNCVIPLLAVIAAYGFNFIGDVIPKRGQKWVVVMLTMLLIVYPFTPSPSAIANKKNFRRPEFERVVPEICRTIRFDYRDPYVYFEHPIVPFYLNKDPFDKKTCSRLFETDLDHLRSGAIVFWESGLTLDQSGITEETLNNHTRLSLVMNTKVDNGKRKIMIYQVK